MESKEIKIVALDLDGTLLDSAKRLSDVNCRALERLAARGVWVVPTTGRFFGMMPECVRSLSFIRYAITVNGAQVYDRQTETALVREEIKLGTALEVMRRLDECDVIYDCYRNNWGWMNEAFKAKAFDYATNEHYLKMIQEFRRGVPELKAHLQSSASEGDVQKIMLFSRLDDTQCSQLRQIEREINLHFPALKCTSSTWNNLEINAASAHKGVALKRFAEALGLSLTNCMAFGDGGNDLTMIENAGVGVAMANAEAKVKAAASYVTSSNDENGVAAALEHFALI